MTSRPIRALCHMGVASCLVTACSGSDDTAAPVRPAIVSAVESCLVTVDVSTASAAEVRGRLSAEAVTFDTLGADEFAGDPIELVACSLVELDAPQIVLAQIEQTRALDGQQVAEWDGYMAVWTYHPDDGLILTVGQRP